METTVEEKAIEAAVRRAGRIALDHFLKVEPSVKHDGTFVTEADLAVQDYLVARLEEIYPDHGVVAEEGFSKDAADGGTVWAIDPIDGTAAFAVGLPVWGIALGRIEGAVPAAGYFYMPTTDDLFRASGDGVFRNDRPAAIKTPSVFHKESLIFTLSRLKKQPLVSTVYPGRMANFGSSMAHIAYTATGCSDGAIIGNAFLWDVAGGMAMLRANGGVVRRFNGEPFVITNAHLRGERIGEPLLAGHPDMVDALMELVAG